MISLKNYENKVHIKIGHLYDSWNDFYSYLDLFKTLNKELIRCKFIFAGTNNINKFRVIEINIKKEDIVR